MNRKVFLWGLTEFAALIAVYVVALTLACIGTPNRLQTLIDQAYEILNSEGDYPTIFGDEAIKIDNYTDRIIVEKSSISNDQSFIAAMWMGGYFRYWHGYVPFLKPVMTLVGFDGVRKLITVIIEVLMVTCLIFLYRKLGVPGAVAFAMMWVDYHSSKVAGNLQFFWPYFILCLSVITICLMSDRWRNKREPYILLFFGIGSFINYVDLLTFPLVTLTVPLLVLLLTESDTVRRTVNSTLTYSIAWGLGYGLTWVVKWLLSAFFLPGDSLWVIWNTALFRMNGNESYPIDRLQVLQTNLNMPYFLGHTGWIFGILVILAAAYFIRTRNRREVLFFCALIPLMLLPYIWYEFFCGHSQIHAFFTYRTQMATSFGLYFFIARFAYGLLSKKTT